MSGPWTPISRLRRHRVRRYGVILFEGSPPAVLAERGITSQVVAAVAGERNATSQVVVAVGAEPIITSQVVVAAGAQPVITRQIVVAAGVDRDFSAGSDLSLTAVAIFLPAAIRRSR